MPLVDDVTAQMKAAMKAKDKPRVQALRNIRAAFIAGMKEDGSDTLSDDQAQAIVRRLAKQLADSIESYQAGGRDDLVASESAELAVVEAFLPKLADEATTRQWVHEAIEATGASSKADMGKVMGHLMKGHKAELDGKLANRIASELLG